MIRKTALFSGVVQGVGFRFTAHRLAQEREVSGFVRNLDDGRVELVAEGEPEQVDGLLGAVRQALGAHIHDVTESQAPATGEYTGFEVAF